MKSQIRRFVHNKNGSQIIEAVIIYPLVLIILIVLFFFIMGLFRQVYLQYIADLAAERGSQYLQNTGVDIETGYFSEDKVTREPMYLNQSSSESEKQIKAYVEEKLNNHILTNVWQKDIRVQEENYIVYRKLKIGIQMRFKTPIPLVNSLLGSEEEGYVTTAYAESVVMDHAEFIRNADLVGDMAMMIPGMSHVSEQYDSTLSTIKEKITAYFKCK